MSRRPSISAFDQAAIDMAIRLGCKVPTFTREDNPRQWTRWELRLSKVQALSRAKDDFETARAEADACAGHLIEVPAVGDAPTHPLFDLLFMLLVGVTPA